MAAKKRNTETKKSALSKEEARVIEYYRRLGRWERNALHMVMQSLAWGPLTEKADRLPWPKIARVIGLPREARHG